MHQVHTESHLEIHNNTEGNSSFHASTEPAAIVVDWPSPCGRLTETIAAPLFWCPFPGLLQPCGTYHSDLWPLDSFTKEQCSVYRNMITFIEGLLISSPQSECFQSSSVTNYPLQMPQHQQWLDWHGSGWWYSLCRGVDHPQILPAWKKKPDVQIICYFPQITKQNVNMQAFLHHSLVGYDSGIWLWVFIPAAH